MEENQLLNEATILAKQTEAINICYDRLLDVLRETTNETIIMKCIEIIRKDMTATMPAVSGKRDAMSDTYERLMEIEKQLKKL